MGLLSCALAACSTEGFPDDQTDPPDAGVRYDAKVFDARPADAPPADAGPPNTGVVPVIGTATTLDVGCWNVENFPMTPSSAKAVADLIASMDLDVVAVVEMNDPAAFQAVLGHLPGWSGVLGGGNHGAGSNGIPPQRLGYLWKNASASLTATKTLFDADGVAFPRPPFQATVTVGAKTFTMIVVHLKAGIDANDQSRRQQANIALEAYARTLTGGVMLCGDFNQNVYEQPDAGTGSVYSPWLSDPARYRFLTMAPEAAGLYSYLNFGGNMLDHMITTSGLDSLVAGQTPILPRLDQQYSSYESLVSDHLPVIVRLAAP